MKKLSRRTILIIASVIAVVAISIAVAVILTTPKKLNNEVLEASIDDCIASVQLPGEETPEYISVMEESVIVTVLSFEKEDDIATALLRIKAPDLYTAAKTLNDSGSFDPETIDSTLAELLRKADTVETELSMTFYLTDEGEWEPVLTEEFLDAYYGGVIRLRDEAYEDYFKDKETTEND